MTLDEIRSRTREMIGKKITIKQKISHRSIPVVYEGRIMETYENLFIIELNNSKLKNKKATFNYRDILTHSIEIEW